MAAMSIRPKFLVLSVLLSITLTNGLRYGLPAKTLHVRSESQDGQLDNGMHTLTASEEEMGDLGAVLSRKRRSAIRSQHPLNLSTTVNLHDSHYQMIIHWAGKDSDVIVALTRDINPKLGANSNVYISRNYGSTYEPQYLRINSTHNATFDKFYNSPVYNSHYVFADNIHQYIFTTTDYGNSFSKVKVPFHPRQISMHSTNANIILAYDEEAERKPLYISQNFGATWRLLRDNVKSFFWGIDPWDPPNTLYVEREVGRGEVLRSSNFFLTTETLIEDIVDFEVKDNYMFASSRVAGSHSHDNLSLWVSHNRERFQRARFPNSLQHQDYFIADASEDQVFLCVNHNGSETHLYISDLSGLSYTLSLPRVVYYNPKGPNADSWLSYFAKESFADIHKVSGLRGVYIASQLTNSSMTPDSQVTYITYNKGALWRKITPPFQDADGKRIHCTEICSLHLTQRFHQLFPLFRTVPILSKESAVGLVMATGSINRTITKNVNVYLSQDGGRIWHEVLKGPHFYQFGDHGGLIVAIPEREVTKFVLYSYDEGESWTSYEISDTPIRIYGLLTEPGEHTTIFSIFGSKFTQRHSWIIIKLDLRAIFGNHSCVNEDYKQWSPGLKGRDDCLLGRKAVFERRRVHSLCYNGRNYVRETSVQNCSCSPLDYECDLGFRRLHPWSISCVPDTTSRDVHAVPSPCPEGTFYPRTKGYRRIAGDTCQGGEAYRYDPDLILCPVRERREFLLYTASSSINELDLTTQQYIHLRVEGLKRVTTVEYDYSQNCLYWADVETQKLQRQFLNGSNIAQTLVEDHSASIEGLALDWMSNILFWVDAGNKRIELLRIAGCVNGDSFCDRRVLISNNNPLNKTWLDRPRAIVVYPKHGLMFWTDWSSTNPRIMRAWMDGSNITTLVSGRSQVFWPNGITVDEQQLRLYWTDAHLDVIKSSDFNGNDRKTILQGHWIRHPYSISIYKDEMYWTDWTQKAILVANKYTGVAVHYYRQNIDLIMDIKIMHLSSQQGTSPCSHSNGGCRSLCVERPGSVSSPVPLNRTCLCSDSYSIQKVPGTTDEHCECKGNERFVNDTCVSVNDTLTCASHQFTCDNNRCVPSTWHCDHDNDCGDMSDERDCPYTTCRDDQMTCADGHCIPARWRCDHDDDCGDRSDEPPSCNVSCTGFLCGNGRCIPESWRCDMGDDCQDGSDEANCAYNTTTTAAPACSEPSFNCTNGHCIMGHWRCDGDNDCGDMSDEINCQNATCPYTMFRCSNGRCILNSWRCDGEEDCADGLDERNCTYTTPVYSTTTRTTHSPGSCRHYQFQCANGNCVSAYERCDGVNDCGDDSDEVHCFTTTPMTRSSTMRATCSPYEFSCPFRCIERSRVCDQRQDCFDNSDESAKMCGARSTTSSYPGTCSSEQFSCYRGGTVPCILKGWVCDGQSDCDHGEDEALCNRNVTMCASSQFRCLYEAACILLQWVCDGDRDCTDGSDEKFCDSFTMSTSVACHGNSFDCKTGECIPPEWVCDGIYQCRSQLDEDPSMCSHPTHSPSNAFHIVQPYIPQDNIGATSFYIFWQDVQPGNAAALIRAIIRKPHTKGPPVEQLTVRYDRKQIIVRNLEAFTRYNVEMTVIVKNISYGYEILHTRTAEGVPTKPQDVALTENKDGLKLSWKPPRKPNGIISKYTIYYKRINTHDGVIQHEDVPVHRLNQAANSTQEWVIHLMRSFTYKIWVTASTTVEGESSDSHVFRYDFGYLTAPVDSLIVEQVTSKSVMLSWNKPRQENVTIDKYFVDYDCEETGEDRFQLVDPNTKTNKYTISQLSPGVSYIFTVYPQNNFGKGPPQSITTRTQGKPLPRVNLTFSKEKQPLVVHINSTASERKDQVYVIYYSTTEADLDPSVIHKIKTQKKVHAREVTLPDLQSCEMYFFCGQVSIPGDKSFGPLSAIANKYTDLDLSAPPEHVECTSHAVNDTKGEMLISWFAPCPQFVNSATYMIYVREAGGIHMGFSTGVLNAKTHMTYTVKNVTRGATYYVQVAELNGRKSEEQKIVIDPYPGPKGFRAFVTDNSKVAFLYWVSADANGKKTNHTYEIYHAQKCHGASHFTDFKSYANTTGFNLDTGPLEGGCEHQFMVRQTDVHGYPGKFTEVETILATWDKGAPATHDSRSGSNNLLLTVLLPLCVLVVAFLVCILVVITVRHQRLQHSFRSFANSHYDTRSETTTFHTGDDLGEEDQPMIRGFSDDEPLVIA